MTTDPVKRLLTAGIEGEASKKDERHERDEPLKAQPLSSTFLPSPTTPAISSTRNKTRTEQSWAELRSEAGIAVGNDPGGKEVERKDGRALEEREGLLNPCCFRVAVENLVSKMRLDRPTKPLKW